jgi:Fe-S-cluster containining protein
VTDPLRFRCTACGECCRKLRVAVTDRDLERLVQASGVAADELVEWLAPDGVDMSGEPESFVELDAGRRLMVLAHGSGGCRWLGDDARCQVYASRPADCRLFPFDLGERKRRPRRVQLLPLVGCDHAWDGDNDETALAADDGKRWLELELFQRKVAHWNRGARHRRRLGRRAGASREFLSFLGVDQLVQSRT